jgi:hypothetical protein
MKSKDLEQKFDETGIEDELLSHIVDIPFGRQAACYFMSILQRRIEPLYKKIEFGPDAATFVFRKFMMNPVYCELSSIRGKEKKVIVKAYDDRKIQICDNNPDLIRVCKELSDKTHGDMKVYLENELKYIY